MMRYRMIPGAPKPVGPFSHAVESDGLVFITGQMPDSPATPGVLPSGIVEQTHAVMANLRTVLSGLGLGFEHVVMARVYLTRFEADYAAMNATYRVFRRGRITRPHVRRGNGAGVRRAGRNRPGRPPPGLIAGQMTVPDGWRDATIRTGRPRVCRDGRDGAAGCRRRGGRPAGSAHKWTTPPGSVNLGAYAP
jgi:2-iminobutanoate/2-iminopropanoate deaminase